MLSPLSAAGQGVLAWTDLSDTPASITALQFVRGNAGGTALEFATVDLSGYLARDGSNTITGVITGDGDQTRDWGADATRFGRVSGRFLTSIAASTYAGGVSGSDVGTRTFGANPTGFAGGNMAEYSTGAAYFRHGSGGGAPNPFKPVGTISNVFSGSGGDASVINNGGGSFLGGSVYVYGSGNATLQTNSFGSFTWAYSYSTGAGNHIWNNQGGGSVLFGYSQGTGAVTVTNNANGCFTAVRPIATGAFSSTVTNRGAGGFINGFLDAATASCLMETTTAGDGGFAQGQCRNGGQIRVLGAGGFAQGDTLGVGSNIIAAGQGSLAHGRARNSYQIRSGGRGSLALGNADTAEINSTAHNSFQFAPGTNSTASSLQVGSNVQLFALTGRMRFTGILETDPTTVTGTTHTAADEHVILCDDDAAGAAITVTLPTAATADAIYRIKKLGSTGSVTVDGNGSENIDDALTAVLTLQYESIDVVSDGTAWWVM